MASNYKGTESLTQPPAQPSRARGSTSTGMAGDAYEIIGQKIEDSPDQKPWLTYPPNDPSTIANPDAAHKRDGNTEDPNYWTTYPSRDPSNIMGYGGDPRHENTEDSKYWNTYPTQDTSNIMGHNQDDPRPFTRRD